MQSSEQSPLPQFPPMPPLPQAEINDADDNDDIGLAPTFTAEEEHLEHASLTVDDIVNIESDLRGITTGIANLKTSSGTSATATTTNSSMLKQTPEAPYTASLSLLSRALSKLPAARTAAYHRAQSECPALVNDERKMAFLERESGSIEMAAKRLAKYWETRLNLFGPGRCFLPMTLDGAMKDEAENLAGWRIFQLMPVTDTAGRSVVFGTPSRRDFSNYSMEQEIMAVWYLLETCMEDPEVRRRGVVFMLDARNMQRKHYSRKLKLLSSLMDSALPIRCRAFHFCYPNWLAHVLLPVLKKIMGRDVRLRLKLHYGSPEKVLRDLESYCLPRDRLPSELGGDVILDMDKWVRERRALEISRADSRLSTMSGEVSACLDEPPPPKKRRSDNGRVSACSSPSASPNTSQNEPVVPIQQEKPKGKAKGRKPDPRMTRAAEAKISNPDMSLHDALIAGGFVFNDKNVDANNITLRQRTNNLCRRIRQEKNKKRSRLSGNEEHVQVWGADGDTIIRPSASPPAIDISSLAGQAPQSSTSPVESNTNMSAEEVEATTKPDGGSTGGTDIANMPPMPPLNDFGGSGSMARPSSNSDPNLGINNDEGEGGVIGIGDRGNTTMSRTTAATTYGNGVARRDSFVDQPMDLPGMDDIPIDFMEEQSIVDEDLVELSEMLI